MVAPPPGKPANARFSTTNPLTEGEGKMQSAKHKSEPASDSWSFVHPLTSEDAAAMTALRFAVADMKGKLEGITARAPFNAIIEQVEAPEDVTFKEDTVGGIS